MYICINSSRHVRTELIVVFRLRVISQKTSVSQLEQRVYKPKELVVHFSGKNILNYVRMSYKFNS